MNKGEVEATKNTFTKSIMSVVVFLYFIGALVVMGLVILSAIMDIKLNQPIDTSMFIAFAAYVGGPTMVGIGFYAWKSKAENLLKIQQSPIMQVLKDLGMDNPVSGLIDILSKMGGN